jgi:hypothetical protein
MIIDTIVFDLVNTRSLLGLFLMYLIQKCFDALLLVYILMFAQSVRLLGYPAVPTALATADGLAAMTTTQAQVPTLASNTSPGVVAAAYPGYLHSQFAQQPASPGYSINSNLPSSTGQVMSPPALSAMFSGQGQSPAPPFPTKSQEPLNLDVNNNNNSGYPHSIPSPQPGEMQTQLQPQPQGQWVFIPHEQVPAGQKSCSDLE